MEKSRMPRNLYQPLKTYFLKVNINCQGCKRKVKKTLRKIEGVYSVDIDTDQQAVMVRGNLDPEILVNKLKRRGKHAQLFFFTPNQFADDNRSSYINIVPSYESHNLNHQVDQKRLMMGDDAEDYFQMTNNSAELFGGNNLHPNLMRDMSLNAMNIRERSDDMMHPPPSLVPQYMNHQQFNSNAMQIGERSNGDMMRAPSPYMNHQQFNSNAMQIGERSNDDMMRTPSQYMNHQQFSSRPLGGFYY